MSNSLNYYLMYSEFRKLANQDKLSLAIALRFVYNIKEQNCFEIVNLVAEGKPFEVSLLQPDEQPRPKYPSEPAVWYWFNYGGGASFMQEEPN